MYRRPSTPPDSERRAKRPSLFLWLVPMAAMAAVLVVLASMEKVRPVYQGRSCQDETGIPRAHTVVVVDQTNALSDAQLLYVKQVILREYLRLQEQDRLTVMGLQPPKGGLATAPESTLFFTTCRVPRGEEVSPINNNPAIVESRFEALVGRKLAALLNSLKEVPEAEWSPIIETLEDVSDHPMFSSSAIARRLVLISDMLQNTKERSQYPRIAARTSGKAPATQFMRAHLLGVDMRVHYIFREGLEAIQNPDHEAYWTRYFTAAGVGSLQIGWGMAPEGVDQIAPIVWNEVPALPVPATSMPATPRHMAPRPSGFDVPPLPEGTLPPGKILVHGTRHAARGAVPAFINYEIDWQPIAKGDSLAFDARRVLLLTSRQVGRECYISVPLVTRMARDPGGGRWGPGRLTRRLEAYEHSERSFADRLALAAGAAFEPTSCEIVGARILNSSGSRYRALRCAGPDFSDISEQAWTRFAQATDSSGVGARLAVVSGRHQFPPADVSRLTRSLQAGALCATEPLPKLEDRLLLGFQWLEERAEPVDSNVEPVISSLY